MEMILTNEKNVMFTFHLPTRCFRFKLS